MERDLFGVVPQTMRETAAVEIVDRAVEYRRAYGVQQLMKVMGVDRLREDCVYHIFTGGNVDMVSHVRWMLHVYGPIEQLTISAWDISMADILLLKRWMNRDDIFMIDLIVGDRFPAKHPKEWERMKEWQSKSVYFDVVADNVHARFMAVKTEDDKCMVLTSSAACTTNPRVELATFTESFELYDFYLEQVHEWKRLRVERKARNEIDDLVTDTGMEDIV